MNTNEKATVGSTPTVASKIYCERDNNLTCAILKAVIMHRYDWEDIDFDEAEALFQLLHRLGGYGS